MSNRLYNQFSYSPERQPINLMGKFTQTVSLANASLINQGITYTAVTAGASGNSITIHIIVPAGNSALIIAVLGSAITITLAKSTGTVTTDADALVAALSADPAASALVGAGGGGSTPLIALATTHLSAGADAVLISNAMNMSMTQSVSNQYIVHLEDEFPELLSAQVTVLGGGGGSQPSIMSANTAFGTSKTIVISNPDLPVNSALFVHLILRNSSNP